MGASFAGDDDNQLKLSNLDPLIRKGQTVTVSYTDPSPGDDTIAIQDEAGNDAAGFANVEMLNNSDADPVATPIRRPACQPRPTARRPST